MSYTYDAVIVGSGPNGLAAAITMQQQGLSTLLIERSDTVGGGMRTKELFGSGNWSDICSAIHPLALSSPFFKTLPLDKFGLAYIQPDILAAHPFDDGSAAILKRSVNDTAAMLGIDRQIYYPLFSSLMRDWPHIVNQVLGPLQFPKNLPAFLRFARNAILPATLFAHKFQTQEAKALWAGMAAHTLLPLDQLTTSAAGLVLMVNGHLTGWPIPKGGSQSIANALVDYFKCIGGKVALGWDVKDVCELPTSKVVLLDVSPKSLLSIASKKLSSNYQNRIQKFRYGAGVFKIDWLLKAPIPFKSLDCRRAGTIHIGGTINEIRQSEYYISKNKISNKPFVVLAQQSLFDATRCLNGHQIAWGYCHVPNGSTIDCTRIIENQVERFAPGFKDLIIAKKCLNTQELEDYNPNYVGGDIGGGNMDIGQLYTRPIMQTSPYRTSNNKLYICSASTPPGGGVHGMCGFHAAKVALQDHWKKRVTLPNF